MPPLGAARGQGPGLPRLHSHRGIFRNSRHNLPPRLHGKTLGLNPPHMLFLGKNTQWRAARPKHKARF